MADAAPASTPVASQTVDKPAPAPLRNWSAVLSQPAPPRKPVAPGPRPVSTVVTGASAQPSALPLSPSQASEIKLADEDVKSSKSQKLPSRPSLVEQHLQHQQPKRTILVLDSGAIIKGVRVERLGTEFWTIAEVIEEIRDQRARDYLQTFPYEIKTTEPDPRDMKAVVEFAKKTGDYASLSAVDMKVIALTRTFEREHNGADHLRAAPLPPTLVARNKKTQAEKQQSTNAQWGGNVVQTAAPHSGGGRGGRGGRRGRGGGRGGAHPHPRAGATGEPEAKETPAAEALAPAAEEVAPATKECETGAPTQTEEAKNENDKVVEVEAASAAAEEAKSDSGEEGNTSASETTATEQAAPASETAAAATTADSVTTTTAADASTPPQQNTEGQADKTQRKPRKKKNNGTRSAHDATQQPGSHPSSRRNSTTPAPPPLVPKAVDDDDAGWITPDNIGQMKRSASKVASLDDLVQRAKVGVACITTDYAMQNVIIQMGLHLLSTDGMVIKRLRTYLLQCHACFKTTKEMEKVFCPNCGHQTLRKVPYMLDERTGQPVLLANRVSRPVSARGTKFSLPLPKGGRQEQKLILREDELLEQTRRRKKKNKDGDDIFDEDQSYLQPRPQSQAKYVVGKLRKNPNESRHRTGKRKKNSGALN